jgi:hypothetical protein
MVSIKSPANKMRAIATARDAADTAFDRADAVGT